MLFRRSSLPRAAIPIGCIALLLVAMLPTGGGAEQGGGVPESETKPGAKSEPVGGAKPDGKAEPNANPQPDGKAEAAEKPKENDANDKGSAALGAADNKRSVRLAKGGRKSVTLAAVPGAGYGWNIVRQPDCIKVVTNRYAQPAGKSPETGGEVLQVIEIEATAECQGELLLRYGRPWEKESAGAKEFSLQITVTP